MMKNPEIAKLVNSPNFMTKMMEQNPYVKQMINKTPGLEKLLNLPNIKQSLMSPDCVQRAMATVA